MSRGRFGSQNLHPECAADPVKAIDILNATSLPSPNNPFSFFLDHFFTLRTARFGEVFRGVDFAPEDNPQYGNY